MNPLTIRVEGYGPFDRVELDLPAGAAAIVGPNGAGKSRLLNAIELALFANGSRDLAQWAADTTDRMLLELEFEHDRELYRIRRTYTTGGRGKCTLDFERNHLRDETDEAGERDDSWISLTRESADATQELICETLGLSRATFGASAFLAQGNTAAFTEAPAAERKRMLGEILDPRGLWPRLHELAKADAAAAAFDVELLDRKIAERDQATAALTDIEQHATSLATAEAAARAALDAAESELERAQQRQLETAAAAERVSLLVAAREHAHVAHIAANAALADAVAVADGSAAIEAELTGLYELADRWDELVRLDREQREAVAATEAAAERRRVAIERLAELRLAASRIAQESGRLTREASTLTDRLEHLRAADDDAERCDRCEQFLGADARQAAIASMTAERNTLLATRAANDAAFNDAHNAAERADAELAEIVVPAEAPGSYERDLRAAQDAVERRPALQLRLEQARTAAAAVPALQAAHAEAETQLARAEHELLTAAAAGRDARQAGEAAAAAKTSVATSRNTLDTAAHDLTVTRQRLEQLRDLEREAAGLRRERSRKQADADVHRLAARAFGRDGIPALIVEQAVPQIEAEANRILELMPTAKGETLRVELRTLAANKTNENVREVLDIHVSGANAPRPYETWSGGERGRLNVALRLALAQLLATRRGAESKLLCLDEVEYLDQLGQDQLVDVVRSVAGVYEKVLVVSHAAGVRDAFETVIEVDVDDEGVSSVAGSLTVAA